MPVETTTTEALVTMNFPTSIIISEEASLNAEEIDTLEGDIENFVVFEINDRTDWILRDMDIEVTEISSGRMLRSGKRYLQEFTPQSQYSVTGFCTFTEASAPSDDSEFRNLIRTLFAEDEFEAILDDALGNHEIVTDPEPVDEDNLVSDPGTTGVEGGQGEGSVGGSSGGLVISALTFSALTVALLVFAFRRRQKGKKDGEGHELFNSFDGEDTTAMGSKEAYVGDIRTLGIAPTGSMSTNSEFDEDESASPMSAMVSPMSAYSAQSNDLSSYYVESGLSAVMEERQSDLDDSSMASQSADGGRRVVNIEKLMDDDSMSSSQYTEIFNDQLVDDHSSIRDCAIIPDLPTPTSDTKGDLLVDVGTDFMPEPEVPEIIEPPPKALGPAGMLILSDDGEVDLGHSLMAHKYMASGRMVQEWRVSADTPKKEGEDSDDSEKSSSVGYHSDQECQVEIAEDGTVVYRPMGSTAPTETLKSYQPEANSGNVDHYFDSMNDVSNASSVDDEMLFTNGTTKMLSPSTIEDQDDVDDELLFENNHTASAGSFEAARSEDDDPDESFDESVPLTSDDSMEMEEDEIHVNTDLPVNSTTPLVSNRSLQSRDGATPQEVKSPVLKLFTPGIRKPKSDDYSPTDESVYTPGSGGLANSEELESPPQRTMTLLERMQTPPKREPSARNSKGGPLQRVWI